MKRMLPLLLVGVLALAVAACSGGDSPTSVPGQTATPDLSTLPAPQTASGQTTIAIQSIAELGVAGPPSRGGSTFENWGVGESLFAPDSTFDDPNVNISAGKLAESWTVASDFSKVTIKVKEGVQFHGGWGEMTAADYVWTLTDFMQTESVALQAGRHRTVFNNPTATDRYTIDLPFNNFSTTWNIEQNNVYGTNLSVLSKDAFDAHGAEYFQNNLIATGPYTMAEFRPAELLRVERFAGYHGTQPALQTVHVREVPEESTRVAMLRNGQADAARITHRNLNDMVADGFASTSSGKANQFAIAFNGNYWIDYHGHCLIGVPAAEYCPDIQPGQSLQVPLERPGYDTSLPWVGEYGNEESMARARKVRQALAMAVDRQLIIDTVLGGAGWQNHLKFFSINSPLWNPDWEVEFNVEEAKRLLDEAGYPAGTGGVRFSVTFQPGHQGGGAAGLNGDLSQAIAGMWSNIGVETTVSQLQTAAVNPTRLDRSLNNPWLNACGGGTARDAAPYDWPRVAPYTSFARPGLGCGMEIPKIEETLRLTLAERDEATRIRLNLELAQYLHDEWLVPGVVAVPEPVVYNPRAYEAWRMPLSNEAEIHAPYSIVPRQR